MLAPLNSAYRFSRSFAPKLVWSMLDIDARLVPAHRPSSRAKATDHVSSEGAGPPFATF